MSLTPLADWLGPYLLAGALIFLRLALVIVFLPALGQGTTPIRVRAMLLGLITFLLDMSLGGLRVEIPDSIVPILGAAGREALIGAGMGLAIRLVFSAVESAGGIAGISMALSHESIIDPSSGEQNGTLGWLLSIAAGLMFIAMDGHHLVIRTLHAHIERHPPGAFAYQLPSLDVMAESAANLARDALVLASPVLVVGLVLNLAITLSARLVPSLNIFAVGIGMLTLCGLLALGYIGDALVGYVESELTQLPETLFRWGGSGAVGP